MLWQPHCRTTAKQKADGIPSAFAGFVLCYIRAERVGCKQRKRFAHIRGRRGVDQRAVGEAVHVRHARGLRVAQPAQYVVIVGYEYGGIAAFAKTFVEYLFGIDKVLVRAARLVFHEDAVFAD